MRVGVIGSGSIGPDLAYGFATAIAKRGGGKVYLVDIKREALDAGMARIKGYVQKGMARGKLAPRLAESIESSLVPTMEMKDLAECEYVLEAATENLDLKRGILAQLEKVVSSECLIGFATSGIPRHQIAAEVRHPERCFVNHPFFPAWRSLPIEVVLSGNEALEQRMIATLETLGKVPIVTADVECFAADDIFVNYCAEAARIFAEGAATPAQVDSIVHGAIGGGGPFNVMDLTRGNLLNVHCLKLMREAATGTPWFDAPPILAEQANTPWHDRKNPGDPTHDERLEHHVLDRILAVLLGRTFFVVDNGICAPRELNWLTRNALGFSKGLLDLAEELGMDRVHEVCTTYEKDNPGFHLTQSVLERSMPEFSRHVDVQRDQDLAVVTIWRPEVMNALNDQALEELRSVITELEADSEVRGLVLTGYGGSLAGADIMELAALERPEDAIAKCVNGQVTLRAIEACSIPVVAALDGPVLGGGSELAMACHARVVGTNLMLGQPEVNLGIIPGLGGTQRLPRLIGVERAAELLRTGRAIGAEEACTSGWAQAAPVSDPVEAAKALVRDHLGGKAQVAPVDPQPVALPERFPEVDLGHHSRAIDAILVSALRGGLSSPLADGLRIEAECFGRCKQTVDFDIGMKNFIQNGPRVPAQFLHE
jgi:enoyl-CoA hydratase/3-hydroxyacyl-CoA dehydrogenase